MDAGIVCVMAIRSYAYRNILVVYCGMTSIDIRLGRSSSTALIRLTKFIHYIVKKGNLRLSINLIHVVDILLENIDCFWDICVVSKVNGHNSVLNISKRSISEFALYHGATIDVVNVGPIHEKEELGCWVWLLVMSAWSLDFIVIARELCALNWLVPLFAPCP